MRMSLLPYLYDIYMPSARMLRRFPSESHYFRPLQLCREALEHESGTQVVKNKDGFQINLDVKHFAPEEIEVKTSSNEIIVEGKQEEKGDEHGYISRHFLRTYVLPDGHDIATAKSTLTSDGVLTVSVQRNQQPGEELRSIPITRTEEAHVPVKEKPQKEES